MKPDKLKKIRAILNSPASTENEKKICRKLLAKHPEEKAPDVQRGFCPSFETPEDAFLRQQAAARQSDLYNRHTGQDAERQRMAAQQARQAADPRQTGFQFGQGGGGLLDALFGMADRATPKSNYSQVEFERAQANINAQRREQERKVDKVVKNKRHFLESLAKALKGEKHGKNEDN